MALERGVRDRRNLLVGGLAVLVLLGVVIGAEIRSRSKSPPIQAPPGYELATALWALQSIAPDGRSILIRVATGDCSRFYGTQAIAARGGVEVRVFNKEPIDDGTLCLDYLHIEPHRVRLPEPLGGRQVLGACIPGNATSEQRLCEPVQPRYVETGVELTSRARPPSVGMR
jgi:hypothetical protein